MSEIGMSELSDSLQDLTELTVVNFGDNILNDESIIQFSKSIKFSTKLQSLSLCSVNMTCSGSESLCKELHFFPFLLVINFACKLY